MGANGVSTAWSFRSGSESLNKSAEPPPAAQRSRSAAAGEQREVAARCTAVLDTKVTEPLQASRHVGNAPSC